MRLVSMNVSGNIHDVCRFTNAMGLGAFVFHMDTSGYNSTVVYRIPDYTTYSTLQARMGWKVLTPEEYQSGK